MKRQDHAYSIEYSDGRASESRTLYSGSDFHLEFDALDRYFIKDVSPRHLDLLRIAESIFVVDRFVRRKKGKQHTWERVIKLKLELIEPGFWENEEVRDALKQAIDFLTGDDWEFEFQRDPSGYEWKRPCFPTGFDGGSPRVCLYSGGLDSAAGLGTRLTECPDRFVLPVTVYHQPRQSELVSKQFRRLRTKFGKIIEPLIVRTRMSFHGVKSEGSQRGRSFLFASAGAVSAILAGVSEVEVYESGIGAINFPLMPGTVGSKTTRGCHPEFLRRMSRLASLVAERPIDFTLPFFSRTKGELVRSLKEAKMADLACETISCARYPLGFERYKQCGVCPGCVFRRQAMCVGGIEEPSGTYTFDLFGDVDSVNNIPSEWFYSLKAFLMQAARWRDIEMSKRLPHPDDLHIRHTRIPKHGGAMDSLIDLLARYRDEWQMLATYYRGRGLQWARLLEPMHIGQGASNGII